MPLFPHRHRRDRNKDAPHEQFANDANWPEPRNDPETERAHPARIPDRIKGPFTVLLQRERDE